MDFKAKDLYFIVFFLFLNGLSLSQDSHKEAFKKAVSEISSRMTTDPESSYSELDSLIAVANQKGYKNLEMNLLESECYYYYIKKDFKQLIESSNKLFEKSKKYKNVSYMATAKLYMGDAHWKSGLKEESIADLKQGLEIIKNEDSDDIIVARANIYILLADQYREAGQMKLAVKNAWLSVQEYHKIKNHNYRKEMLFLGHSNLAAIYRDVNIDSAAYYVYLSFDEQPENSRFYNAMIVNSLTLGIVSNKREEYYKAINHLKEAEDLALEIDDETNLLDIYKNFIDIYQKLGDENAEKQYVYRLSQLELKYSKNQNESLQTIIQKEKSKQNVIEKEYSGRLIGLGIFSILFILGLSITSFYFYRKNRQNKFEKLSDDYLKEQKNDNPQSFHELLEMARRDDPAFTVAFNKVFPDFSNRLLNIDPKLMQSEIEFCTLLKLNLTTKEIARYKSIQPKTVQNKKNRIRKKLNIPEEMDIYHWFNEFT